MKGKWDHFYKWSDRVPVPLTREFAQHNRKVKECSMDTDNTINTLQEHRLELLTSLGLDIDGCTTREELAKRIYSWLEEKQERMELFKSNTLSLNVYMHLEGGLSDLLWEGFKGFANFSKEEWVEEVEMLIDRLEDGEEEHKELIKFLTEDATY